MTEGPDVAQNTPLPPPRQQDPVVAAFEKTRETIVRSVAIATLLILSALVYMRCSDPYWRCKRLNEDADGISGSEIKVWEELECNEWPGI